MNKISAASNLFSALSPSNFIKKKMASLVTEAVASGVNALNKPSGVSKDGIDRIDKIIGDDQTTRFERIFAAHTRAHAVDGMVSHLMNKKDTNGDGVLNVGELGVPEDTFDKIDKNSDGQVGKAELNIAFHARIQAISERTNYLISKNDTNGDGVLNIGELGVPEDVFTKIDKNGDGQAGRVELSIAAHTHAALNNMISEILPPEKSSKLDATV
jgi:uncharacterized protein (DUF2141 family)